MLMEIPYCRGQGSGFMGVRRKASASRIGSTTPSVGNSALERGHVLSAYGSFRTSGATIGPITIAVMRGRK